MGVTLHIARGSQLLRLLGNITAVNKPTPDRVVWGAISTVIGEDIQTGQKQKTRWLELCRGRLVIGPGVCPLCIALYRYTLNIFTLARALCAPDREFGSLSSECHCFFGIPRRPNLALAPVAAAAVFRKLSGSRINPERPLFTLRMVIVLHQGPCFQPTHDVAGRDLCWTRELGIRVSHGAI